MSPTPSKPATRSRNRLLILAINTVILGLSSRRFPIAGNYPGDALWATLVFILWACLLPRASLKLYTALAATTAFCVELSQLYHAPWIDSLRQTLPGRLILGSGFDPFDLIAYLVGCILAIPIVHYFAPTNRKP